VVLPILRCGDGFMPLIGEMDIDRGLHRYSSKNDDDLPLVS